jgi:peptidoglycan/LPS O-acetylase OafA/YrhL
VKIGFLMRRIPQLDGLRALAILMVFATHALKIPLLWMGVDLFFVLSGYLITKILLQLKEQRDGYWSRFYLRRAQRILPPYIVFLFFMGIIGVPWLRNWYWYLLFCANIGVAFHKIGFEWMTPLWSLAVEEQFYLLWPCLVLACNHKNLGRVALAIIVASPCLRAAATPLFADHLPIYCLTIFRADVLAMGAWIAVYERTRPKVFQNCRGKALFAMVAATSVFAALCIFPSFRTSANSFLFNTFGYSLSAVLFGGLLTYALTLSRGFSLAVLSARPLRFLGRISYTFYLWHVAVLELVQRLFHGHTWIIVVVGFLVAVAISYLSWSLFESKILALWHFRQPEIPKAVAAA